MKSDGASVVRSFRNPHEPEPYNPRESPSRAWVMVAACALLAVALLVTTRPVAAALAGFCASFWGLLTWMRPRQRYRSATRIGGAVVLDVPARLRVGYATCLTVPALAGLVAILFADVPRRIEWWAYWTVVATMPLAAVALYIESGERFHVSETGLEQFSAWTRRRKLLPWDEVQEMKCQGRQYAEGATTWGFLFVGRTPKRFASTMFVPEHMDGIGDLAETSLRKLPAHVLDRDPVGHERLKELAARASAS